MSNSYFFATLYQNSPKSGEKWLSQQKKIM
jgi:hypothetical protein